MSSQKRSFENHLDYFSNSTTPNNQNNNNNANADTQDKSINLNEFLDFLNLSCHVNDMISHNNNEFQKQHKDLNHTEKFSGEVEPSTYANHLKSNGLHSPVQFKALYQNRLVNNLFGFKRNKNLSTEDIQDNDEMSSGDSARAIQRSSTSVKSLGNKSLSKYEGGLHLKLNEKLDYVLNEGILDAVLPFICPVPLPSNYTTRLRPKQRETRNQKDTTTNGITAPVCDNTIEVEETLSDKDSSSKVRGKSSVMQLKTATLASANKNEPEVVIHVCDEVKNTSKDFPCPQRLLVSKMGYFADVTAGQNLADMDISVHCDIQIFEWLMKWIKYEGDHSSTSLDRCCGDAPNLNVNNVIPILVSACFLQMEPLLLDCLTFCHSNLGDIVRVSTNLSCLNDTIITRMAAMFTNVELEMVCEKRNRLLPRLWIKLICSLFEPETEALRGHYYSLAGLFKCSKCQKCLTNTMKSYIQCAPGNVRLNRWGQIINHHVREPSWDLNYYLTHLFKEVKSWRLVYWKLWGQAHYLYCCLCEMYFPVYQMFWCRYHPESPVFLGPVAEGCTTGPAGRYTCCGQQTFRYETVPGPHGCQFREHSVLVETDRERSILSIVQQASEGNAFSDAPPSRLQEILANGDIGPRWKCISLMPQRSRQGLLPTVLDPDGESSSRSNRCGKPAYSNIFTDSSSETESSVATDNVCIDKFGTDDDKCSCSTSGSDGCESSDVQVFLPKKNHKKKQNRKRELFETPGRYWSSELSARNNQDHQREFEEKVMKQMMSMVQNKIGSDLGCSQQNRSLGGTYVKLEHEWKEQLKQRTNNSGSSFSSSTQISNTNNSIMLNVKGTRKKVDTNGQ